MNEATVASIVIPLFLLAIILPAQADVSSLTVDKKFYQKGDIITFSGTVEEGVAPVSIELRDPHGNLQGFFGVFSNHDGVFERQLNTEEFTVHGIYNASAFVEHRINGSSIRFDFSLDGSAVIPSAYDVPEPVLKLDKIGDFAVIQGTSISFTATTSSANSNTLTYSLANNPSGSSIDPKSGLFSWTPQVPGIFKLDVIVSDGKNKDTQTITVTVNEKKMTQTESQIHNAVQTVSSKPVISSFVDPNIDPQYYIDRYNNEENYKEWFDTYYPDITIYQAVGLSEPKMETNGLASFVDPNIDPQYYVNRYNNEPVYKSWFDRNYPDMTIEQAVGIKNKSKIPEWVKNIFVWYGESKISEDELLNAIQFLIDQGILKTK